MYVMRCWLVGVCLDRGGSQWTQRTTPSWKCRSCHGSGCSLLLPRRGLARRWCWCLNRANRWSSMPASGCRTVGWVGTGVRSSSTSASTVCGWRSRCTALTRPSSSKGAVSFSCRVENPAVIAQRGIRDVTASVRLPLVRIMRRVARLYDISEFNAAEAALDEALQAFPGDSAVRIGGYMVELAVGGDAAPRSSAEFHDTSRCIRLDDMRREVMGPVVAGGRDELIALWLAKHDGDPTALIDLELETKAMESEHLLHAMRILTSSGVETEPFETLEERCNLLRRFLSDPAAIPAADADQRGSRRSRLASSVNMATPIDPLTTNAETGVERSNIERIPSDGEEADSIRPDAGPDRACGTSQPSSEVYLHSAADDARASMDSWPVSIYLAEGSSASGEYIRSVVQEILEGLGYELIAESDPVIGSFWQRLRAKAREPQTQEALYERMAKLERAAEVRLLALPESQANMQNAQGLTAVIQALEKESAAAIQLGPLLILKIPLPGGGSAVQCKTLTPSQLRVLERQPDLLRDPAGILPLLCSVVESNPQIESVQHG